MFVKFIGNDSKNLMTAIGLFLLLNINIVISLYKSLSDSLPNPATLVSKVLPTGRVTPSVLV